MRQPRLLLGLAWLMFGRICSAQPMLQLTDQTTQVRLDGYVLCLPDLQAQLKATDVVAGAHDLDFAPTPSLNFGFSQADYWLKFTVQDLATLPNRRWVLELAYPNMDLVEMYVVDSAGNFEVRRAGDLLPLSLRELKAYNFSFRLNLPLNGQPRKVYLHFAGRDVKHFPLFLYEETVFFRQIIEENIFWGLYFGFLSIIFLYNLAIWVYVRERLYLYYLFYLASFIGVELTRANGSFGQQFFWPEALWFANYSVHFFTSLTVVSGMLFFSLGLNVRQFFPAFYRVMQLTVGMALLHLGAVVAGWETMPVIWTFSLALVADCLLFFAGVIGLWKGYRPAMLYVLATGSFFAGLIGLFLLEEGLVPEFWVFRHSLNIGSFLETVFLSLALAQSIRLAKDGQRQAEAAQVLAKLELENNRQLTAKLQELDQVKSRFFANISHEFRTPLTLILTPVQQWLTARQLPEPPWPALEGIRQNADSLLRLINQLLELSRLETGTVAVGAEPGDLADFLRQQLAACLAWAEAKQQALVANIPYQKMPAHFDHDKMERVVGNLLGNALKFTPPGGRVELGLRAEGSQVRIWVRDSGIGLAPEEVPKIFDRFYQVDSSGQRAYAGSGLGLALAKELVQLMGGRIAVESQAGKGSLFSLELPLQVTGQEAIEPEVQLTGQLVERTDLVPGKQPVSWPAGSSTDPQPIVLLVEDHPDLRTYLGQQLAVDYQVRLAVDGQQGLEMAREQIPDLVVSDLMMPRLDGLALCHQLKVDPRTCHIPVLMLTAKAGTDSKIEGLAHGADDYLVKPFELAEVRARVANLLAQRQRLRDYYRRDVSLLAPHPKLASLDEQFLQKLHAKIEAMIDDTTLGVEHLCEVVNLSRSQLHRKLQAITGQSATEFIRSARLRRAAHLLAQKQGNVSEIAYSVGYDNLSYFSRSFKEQYGVPPSEYQG